jgi:hypothetical protein
MSVGTLLGTPAAAGLFAKAIAQSGAAHNVTPMDDAAVVTEAFVAELGGGDSTPWSPPHPNVSSRPSRRVAGHGGRPASPVR